LERMLGPETSRRTYPSADAAVVLFDLYFWERLSLDSECDSAAMTTSSIDLQSVAFKLGQFARKLRGFIGRLIFVPAIMTSKSISLNIFEETKHS
jgi:hypothetical protein